MVIGSIAHNINVNHCCRDKLEKKVLPVLYLLYLWLRWFFTP